MALSERRKAWVREVHASAARTLVARGLGAAAAWWCALAFVSHWVRETGWGDRMAGNNVGNIRASRGWTGPTVTQRGSDDPEGGAPYRAYATLDEGAAAAIALAADGSLYRAGFAALVASCSGGPYVVRYEGREASIGADAVTWYAALMRAGWHPYSEASLEDYRGVVVPVAGIVGGPPVVVPLAVGFGLGAFALGVVEFVRWFKGW